MDSMKVPYKGQPGKDTFSIRFNANDDSLDDIYNTSSTQSGSATSILTQAAQQPPEESIWKRDFLQSSFFGRKRSNSIENNSASAPNVSALDSLSATSASSVAGPSTSNSNSPAMDTTTWARFKGKVNQAMEDIKSSSTSQRVGSQPATTASSSVNGSQTAQSSISEDYVDPESEVVNGDADNSDDDVDSEIFNEPTPSRLKRSIRHIRDNKEAIKGSLRRARESTKDKMFGRSATRKADESAATKSKLGNPPEAAEIESGVEMVEDMVVAVDQQSAADSADLHSRTTSTPNHFPFTTKDNRTEHPASATTNNSPTSPSSSASSATLYAHLLAPIISSTVRKRSFALCVVLLGVLYSLSIPPFLQGVIACLFSMVAMSTLHNFVSEVAAAVVSLNNPLGPERTPFAVPDYNKMSVCEIPAAEEHTSLKVYSGWLNEVNNYDPENYHLGMMKSVFVKLDGTRLKVSNVANRVPKRSMWNETLVEKRHIIVTMNRTFDLRNCRVEMLPKGLARKRYFNRKYPMQLIIPNGLVNQEDEAAEDGRMKTASSLEGISPEAEEKLVFLNDFDSTDFGTTILTADTASLAEKNQLRVPEQKSKVTTPSGDEVRLIFFARCDREKEDWYRRFQNASVGAVRDNEHPTANYKYVTDKEAQAMRQVTQNLENLTEEQQKAMESAKEKDKKDSEETNEAEVQFPADSQFDGLLMTPCSARSHPDYVKFMAKYQTACKKTKHPKQPPVASPEKKSRRERKEDDLWKGIDQSLFLGPTADVVWANVLMGRVMYSCLNNEVMLEKIQDFLQKKLSAIKLPNFMEDVTIAQLCLGDQPPLVHRISQPLMDERGTWIDADLTYEGLVHATVTTKLNLLRLRRQQGGGSSTQDVQKKSPVSTRLQMSSIYDSDAESTGGSSSESESSAPANNLIVDSNSPGVATISGQGMGVEVVAGSAAGASSSGGGRKLLRIVDKITASNLFQSATEISYVQRAMENMSTRIKLRVELKGLVARVVLNIPPPPSDRVWIGFRGPPRLWITAKPALGEHSVDWSLVTNVIENKLCEEVYKYLVYPNMVDVIVPILGQSTYKEEEEEDGEGENEE